MNKYARHGAGTIWLFVEPLGPWRTAVDWARQVQAVVDHPRYRQAECLTLVCDNWNTHTAVSFYQAFPPAEARRLTQRVRSDVYAPARQLAQHSRTGTERPDASGPSPAQTAVHAQVAAWAEARNAAQTGIDWPFRTACASKIVPDN